MLIRESLPESIFKLKLENYLVGRFYSLYSPHNSNPMLCQIECYVPQMAIDSSTRCHQLTQLSSLQQEFAKNTIVKLDVLLSSSIV